MAQRYRDDGTKQNAENYCCSEDNKIGIFRGMNHSANQGRKSFDGGLGTGYFKRIAALNDGARANGNRLLASSDATNQNAARFIGVFVDRAESFHREAVARDIKDKGSHGNDQTSWIHSSESGRLRQNYS